jgi:hypothetical protein
LQTGEMTMALIVRLRPTLIEMARSSFDFVYSWDT